jgi:hypothetical protein
VIRKRESEVDVTMKEVLKKALNKRMVAVLFAAAVALMVTASPSAAQARSSWHVSVTAPVWVGGAPEYYYPPVAVYRPTYYSCPAPVVYYPPSYVSFGYYSYGGHHDSHHYRGHHRR